MKNEIAKKIVAVIVTHNRLERLKKCWAAIACQSIYGAVIVNNNSTDGTKEWIESIEDERLRGIHIEKNSGGAGGFRRGCEYSLEFFKDADWFLLFDDDAYAQPQMIDSFSKAPADSDLISTRVLTPSGRSAKMNTPLVKVPSSIGDIFNYLINRNKFSADPGECNSPVKVAVSSFVGLFVSHRCLKKMIGAIRPEFFIYCDDAYFTYQAYLAGFKNYYMPNLVFFHDIATSSLLELQLYYLIRNDVVVKKAYSPNYFYLLVIARFVFYAIKTIRTDKTWIYLMVMVRALLDGIKIIAKGDSKNVENDIFY